MFDWIHQEIQSDAMDGFFCIPDDTDVASGIVGWPDQMETLNNFLIL